MGKLIKASFLFAFILCMQDVDAEMSWTSYVLPCDYNDKAILLTVSVDDNFSDAQKQDIFRGTCKALKAFRECKTLRREYLAQKRLGTKIMTQLPLFILKSRRENTPLCGFGFTDNANEIWLLNDTWDKELCNTPAQTIFHEFLHKAGMPNHHYDVTGDTYDPIERMVRACLP